MLHIRSEHILILHAYVIWMKLQFCFNWSVMPGSYYCCEIRVIQWQSTHFFPPLFFLNLLDSMSYWWPVPNLSKLLESALTMQFRMALNEAGIWQWIYLSLTLIVLNLIHSLAFIFISCCQCICQTLLNVPNRCPLECPIFSCAMLVKVVCLNRRPLHRFPPLCCTVVLWWAALELGNGKVVGNGSY